MKKYRLLFMALTLVLLVGLLSACAAGTSDTGTSSSTETETTTDTVADTSWDDILAKGELVIGLDDNYPPIGFHDESGDLVGSDIELAQAACDYLGIKAVFKPVQWDGVVLSLKGGDIDVIWNFLGVNEDRAKEIDFSQVYADIDTVLIVKKDSGIEELEDLEGKIIGVQLNDPAETAITNNPISSKIKEIRKYNSHGEIYLDLQAGRVDVMVVDAAHGCYLLATEGVLDDYNVLNFDLRTAHVAVGIRKDETALADKINEAIDALKADGTVAEINEKWFGSTPVYITE